LAAALESSALPLVIVGNWDASHYGRELRSQYEGKSNIHLLDPIYDQEVLGRLRDGCHLYLHGHSAGGTNPSLVEAMYAGLPIYAFDVDYNRETTEQGARYFASSSELVELLAELDDVMLKAISERMVEVARRRYRWELVANQYAQLLS
jgi:glycosyltransferase involved in cell wall biosynthesis